MKLNENQKAIIRALCQVKKVQELTVAEVQNTLGSILTVLRRMKAKKVNIKGEMG